MVAEATSDRRGPCLLEALDTEILQHVLSFLSAAHVKICLSVSLAFPQMVRLAPKVIVCSSRDGQIDIVSDEIRRRVDITDSRCMVHACGLLCVGTRTGSIHVLEPSTGKVLHRSAPHLEWGGCVSCLTALGSSLCSGDDEGRIVVTDLAEITKLRACDDGQHQEAHHAKGRVLIGSDTDCVTCLEVADGKLFSGGDDGTIRMFKLETGHQTIIQDHPPSILGGNTIGPTPAHITCMEVVGKAEGPQLLYAGNIAGQIRLFHARSGQLIRTVHAQRAVPADRGHTLDVVCMCAMQSQPVLCAALGTAHLIVLEASSGQLLRTVESGQGYAERLVSMLELNRQICIGRADGAVILHDMSSGDVISILQEGARSRPAGRGHGGGRGGGMGRGGHGTGRGGTLCMVAAKSAGQDKLYASYGSEGDHEVHWAVDRVTDPRGTGQVVYTEGKCSVVRHITVITTTEIKML